MKEQLFYVGYQNKNFLININFEFMPYSMKERYKEIIFYLSLF